MLIHEFLDPVAVHSFFFFLGTAKGELLKRVIELLIFLIITYMIMAEYRRESKREYKYLIIAFAMLMARQLIMIPLYWRDVFSEEKFIRFYNLISVGDHYLELLGIILLCGAFLFPIYKRRAKQVQAFMLYEIIIVSILCSVIYIKVAISGNSFNNYVLSGVFENFILMLTKILLLLAPAIILLKTKTRIKYQRRIILAFLIYTLRPITVLYSYLTNGELSGLPEVIQHPFTIIAILIFSSVVYNKLADKAFLKKELELSKHIIEHEKDLNKLKSHFISVVSHELKTPITSIKLYLSLMKSGKFGSINKKQKESVDVVLNESNRLNNIVTDLLTVSRLEAKKLTLEKTEFIFYDVIDPIYVSMIKKRGLTFVNKVPKNLSVKGDRDRVKQILINLLNNAMKFTEQGGLITLSANKKKNTWEFSVKDTGIGVDENKIKNMFDKFYQLEDPFTRKHAGFGLGLSIVKGLVDLHEGTIDVTSKKEIGTTFKITLPL